MSEIIEVGLYGSVVMDGVGPDGASVTLTLLGRSAGSIRIGIEAPKSVVVLRSELVRGDDSMVSEVRNG